MGAKNKLSALKLKNAPSGKYNDGDGLWFHRRSDGGAQWFLRYTIYGRRREMGLGSFDDVSLSEARELAHQWRSLARQGKDPIKEREKLQRDAARTDSILATVAEAAFEARKAELKGDGEAGRWFTPLRLHVLPKLGKTPVEEIDQNDIANTLKPIWHTKADTARKAMNRLGIALRHGAAMGFDVDLQATDKAKELLGKTRHKAKSIPSLPWQDVPAFYATLGASTMSRLALRLLILTAVRSGPLRQARWDEIDGNTWVIPADKMKSLKDAAEDFYVPLSSEAQRVLDLLRPFERDGYVFPNARKGVLSDMTMLKFLKDQGHEFRPHGFRSSFSTWVQEATDTPDKVAKHSLSHSVGTKVDRAYARTTLFEKRRILMEKWGKYVSSHSGVSKDAAQ